MAAGVLDVGEKEFIQKVSRIKAERVTVKTPVHVTSDSVPGLKIRRI